MSAHEAFNIPIVAVEGVDGAGKTTLFQRLRSQTEFDSVHFTGEFESAIGSILKNTTDWGSDPILKLYAFAADRAFIFRTISALRPRPKLVVWDRYVNSAIVYREAERRLQRSPYGGHEAEVVNSPFPKPTRVIFLSIPVSDALNRKSGDRELLSEVSRCYEELVCNSPETAIIDAARPIEGVVNDAKREIADVLRAL